MFFLVYKAFEEKKEPRDALGYKTGRRRKNKSVADFAKLKRIDSCP